MEGLRLTQALRSSTARNVLQLQETPALELSTLLLSHKKILVEKTLSASHVGLYTPPRQFSSFTGCYGKCSEKGTSAPETRWSQFSVFSGVHLLLGAL